MIVFSASITLVIISGSFVSIFLCSHAEDIGNVIEEGRIWGSFIYSVPSYQNSNLLFENLEREIFIVILREYLIQCNSEIDFMFVKFIISFYVTVNKFVIQHILASTWLYILNMCFAGIFCFYMGPRYLSKIRSLLIKKSLQGVIKNGAS